MVGKAQSPAFNVMALDDTDQIPISLVPIAMVRRLRLVPSAAAVESLADLGTIANLLVTSFDCYGDAFGESARCLLIYGLNLMQCASLTKHSGPDSD